MRGTEANTPDEKSMMAEARDSSPPTGRANAVPGAGAGPNLSLISTQLSWMRSDLSNLRTLLAWARTSVSMIGFGFTIYNFYRGFLEDLTTGRGTDAARNLGMALVATGTFAMVVAVWNYWSINQYLQSLDASLDISGGLRRRWIYSYVLAAVIAVIGVITLLFMFRVI